jgi:hypothetical protein
MPSFLGLSAKGGNIMVLLFEQYGVPKSQRKAKMSFRAARARKTHL